MQDYYAPDFAVKIEGLTMAADVRNAVIDLTYDNNLDTADMFTLSLNNADMKFTDAALFNVGKNIEIHMGYVGDLRPMILGEITAIRPTFPESGAPTLTVTGYDKSHRMRHNQPGRFTFKSMNDSVIAARIAAENLLIPVIDPAPMPVRESVQQTGSDWALLKELAERNFFQVYVYWDKLYFRFPRPQTEMVTLEWGKNLSSFTPRLSTGAQHGIQIIRGYDYKLCQEIVAVLPAIALGSDLDDLVERLGSSFIDQLVKLGRHVIRDQPVENYLDATILAKSLLKQLLDGLYEGSGNCIGIPTLRAGDKINIRGVGKRFSGNYTLSKVTHSIGGGGYQTRFEVTQKSTSTLLQSLRKKIAESPSPNRQERKDNVVIGVVKNNKDPERFGRVQVSFPHLSDGNLSAWARVATPMAGNGMGMYFLPDVKDEVLVQFEHGDINRPLVVGSVWNGCGRPPEDNLDGRNRIRKIKSKAGHTITFDDTPGAEHITITDKAGSIIKLEANGALSIQSKGDLNLQANGQNGNLNLNANGDINLNAANVNVSVSGAMDVS